jgi:putative methyltransferase
LAERVIRCSPDEDATNGFFVSCFVRFAEEDAEQASATDPNTMTVKEAEEWVGIVDISTADGVPLNDAARAKKRRKKKNKTQS